MMQVKLKVNHAANQRQFRVSSKNSSGRYKQAENIIEDIYIII